MTNPHTIRLSKRDADAYMKRHRMALNRNEAEQVHDYVAAYFGPLARGTVFVANPTHDGPPVVFVAQIAGHRTHVLVAREYGDVSWPAWLHRQRLHAVGDAVYAVREAMRPITTWIEASKHECARRDQEQRWPRIVTDGALEPGTAVVLGYDPGTGEVSPERSMVLRGIA